jgi:hypothetical protein
LKDNGIFLTKEAAYKLDYWSKIGIKCNETLEESLDLVDQVIKAKLQSDSSSVMLQRSLFNIKNEVQLEKIEKSKLLGIIDTQKSLITVLNNDNKKLQRNVIVAWSTGITVFITTIFLLK